VGDLGVVSVELRLVLLCARGGLGSLERRGIEAAAAKVGDWDAVLDMAVFYRVASLVCRALKEVCPEAVPGDVMGRLKAIYSANMRRNFVFCARLLQILNFLGSENIAAVPFKGPVLAQRVYGDTGLRHFSDLDILVCKQDALKAFNLLLEKGFETDLVLGKKQAEKYLDHKNAFELVNPKDGISVDLHWEMTSRYSQKHIYLEDFEDRLDEVLLLDKPVSGVPDSIMVVYLAMHGTHHFWSRLEWVACFAEMVRKKSHEEFKEIFKTADAAKARRMFLLGLYIARKVFGDRYPDFVEKQLIEDKEVAGYAERLAEGLLGGKQSQEGRRGGKFAPLHFRIRDTYVDRLKYIVYLYTTPTSVEYKKFPLPASLIPLYRIIRPLRLAVDYFEKSGIN
jgi:hypothetical protein